MVTIIKVAKVMSVITKQIELCRIVNNSVGQWDQIHESVITGDNTQLQKGS